LEQLAAKLNLPVADVLTESKSALSPEKPGMSSIESKKIVGTQVKRIPSIFMRPYLLAARQFEKSLNPSQT
jgi:hypothetical protein